MQNHIQCRRNIAPLCSYCDFWGVPTKKYKINFNNIAYIGDDINDLTAIEKVGLSFAPDDVTSEIIQIVNRVTLKKSGEGVLRELIDFILG